MGEPRRSSFLTWLLIGLSVVLLLGTTGAVVVPFARCPECRTSRTGPNGAPVRRVKVAGKWETSQEYCNCCGNRGRVTLLNYGLTQARSRR